MGTVVDQGKFDAAFTNSTNKPQVMSSKVTSALPPWWLLKGVKPVGSEKDVGSWKAITFSKAQQANYGVDEDGTVVDQGKFGAAFNQLALLAPEPEPSKYNCSTEDLWSQEKQNWCCENKRSGCPRENKTEVMCCEAMIASCLACQQGKTIQNFCKDPTNAKVGGCPPAQQKALRGSSAQIMTMAGDAPTSTFL